MSDMVREKGALFMRNFIFGVEDSLVSTVGLLSGIAIAQVPRETILLTGVVLIVVEAFSMGAGSFLSEYSVEDYVAKREVPMRRPLSAGVIMFISYFVAGFVPLFPYILFEAQRGFLVSVVFSLLALFVLGIIGGKMARVKAMKNAVRMTAIGGLAIVVGVLVGGVLNIRG